MERLEVPHYMYEITVSKLDYAESRLQHKAAQIEKSKIAAYRELARMRADYFYELREMLEAYMQLRMAVFSSISAITLSASTPLVAGFAGATRNSLLYTSA